MGYKIALVTFIDRRRFDRVTIVGRFITRIGDSTQIPFKEADIESIVVDQARYPRDTS